MTEINAKLGSPANPYVMSKEDYDANKYPDQSRPYVYVQVDGQMIKWYRSYTDYCDD